MEYSIKPSKTAYYTILGFAAFSILLHLYTNLFAGYGIFRDELYYIACSNRLDAGYVDQPPFSIYVLYISRLLFGESVFAVRLLPAVVSGAVVFFTGLLTSRMGGGVYAILVSCTSITLAPIFVGMNAVYSMNTFDYLFWVLAIYLIVKITQQNRKTDWYLLGITAGLGLLNKIGFLWFGAGLFVGMLITNPKVYLRKEIYIAGLFAFILFLPYIIWNFTHDFAHLEFISNATKYKYSGISALDFAFGQILTMNPVSFPVWIAGLLYLILNNEGKKYRILALIYLVTFLILLINGHSKPEYLGTAYVPLLAAGGVIFEKFFAKKNLYKLRFILPLIITLSGLALMPVVLPVLPVETFIAYQKIIGIEPGNSEGKELNELHQFYSDMYGWENMAKTVSDAYLKLSPEERKHSIILAQNYGEAGAIEYFSNKYPLPQVISYHNNYWYWLDEVKKEYYSIIIIGGNPGDHLKGCGSVEKITTITNRYAMPYETNLPVYICRNLKINIREIWNEEKRFI